MTYEQLHLDTRSELEVAITDAANDAIREIRQMIAGCPEAKSTVRNRHEAYGVAAENYARIADLTKQLKNDCADLLTALPDPNFNAVEPASVIANDTAKLAMFAMQAAATLSLTLDSLYLCENENRQPSLEDTTTSAETFSDAEPIN